jgi:hypothetical protein
VQALAGSIHSPMSREQSMEKFVDCASQAAGRRDLLDLNALAVRILGIDAVPDVSSLVRKLAG